MSEIVRQSGKPIHLYKYKVFHGLFIGQWETMEPKPGHIQIHMSLDISQCEFKIGEERASFNLFSGMIQKEINRLLFKAKCTRQKENYLKNEPIIVDINAEKISFQFKCSKKNNMGTRMSRVPIELKFCVKSGYISFGPEQDGVTTYLQLLSYEIKHFGI